MNRRGSYIAEAAVVLPVIIFAVITVVLIVMLFYEQSVNQSRMHMALRCEAGQITGKTVTYNEELQPLDAATVWDGNIASERKGLFRQVAGDKEIQMIAKGILSERFALRLSDTAHAADGVNYIRLKGAIGKEAAEDDEQN